MKSHRSRRQRRSHRRRQPLSLRPRPLTLEWLEFRAMLEANLNGGQQFNGDSGNVFDVYPGSDGGLSELISAISSVNNDTGDGPNNPDTISIDQNCYISPTTNLPAINRPVVILGNGAVLNGSSDSDKDGIGLQILGGSGGVDNLAISGFNSIGLNIGSDDNAVYSSYFNGNGAAVVVGGTGNEVGSANPPLNVLTDNVTGILLGGSGNSVDGNYIGVEHPGLVSGLVAAPNTTGVEIEGSNDYVGVNAANIISGNSSDGILIDQSASGNVIVGNAIGTDDTFNSPLGNHTGIEINGSGNFIGVDASGNPDGNTISGNSGDGALIAGSNNQFENNNVGVNGARDKPLANGGNGVSIISKSYTSSSGNDLLNNSLSENVGDGVYIGTGNGNILLGNTVSSNGGGYHLLGLDENGVEIAAGATGNLIGEDSQGNFNGNVIVQNQGDGIRLDPGVVPPAGNVIVGNFIGDDQNDDPGYGNGGNGITIGTSGNYIGVDAKGTAEGNVISGNAGDGADISGSANEFENNDVGVNLARDKPVPNAGNGVTIISRQSGNSSGNHLVNNGIAENGGDGVYIGSGSGNVLVGNTISSNGTNSGQNGIEVASGAASNLIGEDDQGNFNGNLIVENHGDGILLDGPDPGPSAPAGNVIVGNFIGDDHGDDPGYGNAGNGIAIGTSGNYIGVDAKGTAEGNVISGNAGDGADIFGSNNEFENNDVGVNLARDKAVPNSGNGVSIISQQSGNSSGNYLGANSISDNGGDGVYVGSGSGNVLVSNIVSSNGDNALFQLGFGEPGSGIEIAGDATDNLIGEDGQGNFDGNEVVQNYADGIVLDAAPSVPVGVLNGPPVNDMAVGVPVVPVVPIGGARGNVIVANYIGLDFSNHAGYGNAGNGVTVESSGNFIGTDAGGALAGNIIAGNTANGLEVDGSANIIQVNDIGIDVNGHVLANGGSGILVHGAHNTVGVTNTSPDPTQGNVISANGADGVLIQGAAASHNNVAGNRIGTDYAGANGLGKQADGVHVDLGASLNTIGGTTAVDRNIIGGNTRNGIEIDGDGPPPDAMAVYFGSQSDSTSANDVAFQRHTVTNPLFGSTSAAGYDGTVLGDETTTPGPLGQAFTFSAAGGAIDVPNPPPLIVAPGVAATFAALVNPSGSGGQATVMAYNAVTGGISLQIVGSQLQARVYDTQGQSHDLVSPIGSVTPGIWQGVAMILSTSSDGSQTSISLFVNGQSVASATERAFTPDTLGGSLSLGAAVDSNNQIVLPLIGSLDEAGVWNRALLPDELAQMAADGGTGLNAVLGNSIGIGAGGGPAVNGGDGILIDRGDENVLGSPGAPNLIGDNGSAGISIVSSATSDALLGAASTNQVLGNAIQGNSGAGVLIGDTPSDSAIGNTLSQNLIDGNGKLGIDLGNDGVTLNPSGQLVAAAPNRDAPSPTITSALATSTTTTINANVPAATGGTVEFFANDAADASGYGQGQTYLGSMQVDGQGNAQLIYAGDLLGKAISATYTDPSGDTSEFSEDEQPIPALTVVGSGAISVTEGAQFAAILATIDELGLTAADTIALIDWGDGQTTTGAITPQSGRMHVEGSHTYGQFGDYNVKLTIADSIGQTATAADSVSVAAVPLTLTGANLAATEGLPVSGTLASLDQANATSADFHAEIVWGDGATTSGTISPEQGAMGVVGTHIYARAGAYGATVIVYDADGQTQSVLEQVSVADAPLNALGKRGVNFTEGVLFSRTVGTFSDADPNGSPGDYTATVDWGDGTQPSPGTVSADGAAFDVSGSHSYVSDGAYSITLTVSDPGGAVATTTSTANVEFAAKPAPGTITVTGNKTFSNGLVASFSQPGIVSANEFTAVIDWGDGATSNVSLPAAQATSGVYAINSTHNYSPFDGAKNLTVTITDTANGVSNSVVDTVIDPLDSSDLTANQRYALSAYQDTFGATAELTTMVAGASLGGWAGQLDGGLSRSTFANALLHSDEYYASLIRPLYLHDLGRAADADGLAYWIGQMKSGLTDEQLEADFIGSPEFYAHVGGTDKLWVDAMYANLLGRAPDAQGESYWIAQLDGGATRAQVAYSFAASPERERERLTDDYMNLLGRAPDGQGLDYWTAQFAGGVTNEDVLAGFVASDEYYHGHSA